MGSQFKKAILKGILAKRGVFDNIGPATSEACTQRWPSSSSQVIGPLALATKGFAAMGQLGKLGLVELARA
jgi:hypothetical protein